MTSVSLVQRDMIAYFATDPRRIHHFLKVYALAKAVGELEGLDAASLRTLEIAALTHDIGIRESERKYASASGELQQQEGPGEARRLLEALDVESATVDRVCWLIAHHHTYQEIQGLDYQILVEADFLVNLYEDGLGPSAAHQAEEKIFRTATGVAFLRQMYGMSPLRS